jgi:cupin 2 domain-containing protein
VAIVCGDEIMINTRNLFADIPVGATQEIFEDLLHSDSFRIERIISHGEASPEGFWYDQTENEWILLLAGGAELSFADGQKTVLAPGDCLLIPAHARHRVEKTDQRHDTIWLAVHFSGKLTLDEGIMIRGQ